MRRWALALATILLAPCAAHATIILDTYPANGVLWKPIGIAIPFGPLGPNAVVTGITAAVRGSNGTVAIGVMTDAGGVPSGHYVFSDTLTPTLSADIMLRDLDWRVPGQTPLWLAVLESPSFSFGDGFWQANAGLDRAWAFEAVLGGPWFGHAEQSPAALIEAKDIPEPRLLWLPLAALALGAAATRLCRGRRIS